MPHRPAESLHAARAATGVGDLGQRSMCQGDPDVSRVLEADRSLPHQVEVDATSAQFGEISGHHAEFGIELHPHRHHPIAAH